MSEITTINELALMLKNHIDSEQERHDNFDTKLDKIEEQTKKTNGSVRTLFIWRAYITGGIAVLSAIVIPIAAWLLQYKK